MNQGDVNPLSDAITLHWQMYVKRLRDCRHQATEEHVHKLRTGIRRLLALIELLEYLTPRPLLQKLRKNLKSQLKALSELRDIQVQRLEISAMVGEIPQLAAILHQLHLQELQQLIELPTKMKHWRASKMRRKFDKQAGHWQRKALSAEYLVGQVNAHLATISQMVDQRRQDLQPDMPASFHRLRIAIKKLRYCQELAAAMFPECGFPELPTLKNHQEALGEIQNDAVLLQLLVGFFGADSGESIRLPIAERLQRQLADYQVQSQELLNLCQPQNETATNQQGRISQLAGHNHAPADNDLDSP